MLFRSDNPINQFFQEKNIKRVWALTEDEIITHDTDEYNYGKMEKIIVIKASAILWNRSYVNNISMQRPVCVVYENGNKKLCNEVNIKGPSICIFNEKPHPLGMNIWMETNAELELIR